MRVVSLFVVLASSCVGFALAADPFAKGTLDVRTYGGPLYEPRYCDPNGHLPMSACVMANLTMAEDYLLRAIYAKDPNGGLNADAIRVKARQSCERVYAEALKRYKGGDLIDIEHWSCIRRAYHAAAADLLK
jgi:hypothetical protein